VKVIFAVKTILNRRGAETPSLNICYAYAMRKHKKISSQRLCASAVKKQKGPQICRPFIIKQQEKS